MKLSELAPGPVQQAGGFEGAMQQAVEVGHQQARAWQAGIGVADAAAQVGLDIVHGVTRAQTNDAVTRIKVREAQLKNALAEKKAYTYDEAAQAFGGEANIPKEVSALFPKDSGQMIPAFAIQGQLFSKARHDIVDQESSNISIPGFRDQFKKAAHADADMDVAHVQGNLLQERHDWELAKLSNNVDALARVGDFDTAKGMIANNGQLSPAQKEQSYEKLLHEKGKWGSQLPLRGTDMKLIDSTIAGLEKGDNKFDTVDGSGKEGHVDVEGLTADERRRSLTELRSWKDHLVRAAKESDKHQYDAADATIINALGKVVANGNNINDLTAVARQVFSNPDAFSPSMRKYVIGQLESRQNLAFTRQQVYGFTPDKGALSSFNSVTTQGDGNAHVKGPDGVDWGPLKDLDVLKYAQNYGINKADQVKGMLKDREATLKGKPTDKTALRQDITQTVNANGMLRQDDDSKETQEHKAALEQYAESRVDTENADRASRGEKPMSRDETKKFLQTTLSDPEVNKKVTDGGTTIFGNPREVAAPKFSGLSAKDLQVVARIRGSIRAQYGIEPWQDSGEATAAGLMRARKLVPYVQDSPVGQKLRLSPEDQLRYGVEIDMQKDRLSSKLEKDLNRKPTQKEMVQEFFRERFPNAGLKDPRASVTRPGDVQPGVPTP